MCSYCTAVLVLFNYHHAGELVFSDYVYPFNIISIQFGAEGRGAAVVFKLDGRLLEFISGGVNCT